MKRYNLPLNDNYSIIDSYYTGGMENACTCDNCGALITNVAEIENTDKQRFNVGMDCAETLSNLQGLYNIQCEFAELKGLMQKVSKAKRENKTLSFSILSNGDLLCEANGLNLFRKEIEFSKKYLNHYLKLVTNPEKIGYKPKQLNIVLGFDSFLPRTNIDFTFSLLVDKFKCIVSVKPYFHLVNNEISGYDFYLEIPELNVSKRCTTYRRISDEIEWEINKHYFELY